MKTLCVLLPHFPLKCELMQKPAASVRPAIITYTAGSQKLVLDWEPELDGLQPDMPLQEALSLHGEAALIHADMPRYRSVWNGILDALELKSPLVEGAEPGCAYVGLGGMHIIYPDDAAAIAAVQEVIPPAFAPRLGIGNGKFLAYLAAMRGQPGECLSLPPDIRGFLQDLPCDVLPVSLKAREKLRAFGLKTLGQVAVLPPGPMLSQFGPEGARIRELALGIDETPLLPRLTEEGIEEIVTLSSVTVSLDAILVAADAMLSRIFVRTAPRGLGIRSLVFWTRTWNAEEWERTVQFKEPAMTIKGVISRLKRTLEDYPQPGPVEQAGIRIKGGLGYPGGRQRSLFTDIRARDDLLDDIRQLEFRLGDSQVFKVKEVEPWSRIPERRYALTPIDR